MVRKMTVLLGCIVVLVLSQSFCGKEASQQKHISYRLVDFAQSERLWTGIAVSKEGRVFTNYPRWSEDVPVSVAEITASGDVIPFPDARWNSWDSSKPPKDYFVCVQSVTVDRENFLWILDPALSIYHGGVVGGGPKLIKVDLATNQIVQKILFSSDVAPQRSYLNDVRVDTESGFAYITDSGLGAIVVVDLSTGESRRLLTHHPSVKAEDVTLTIEGREWLQPDGSRPQVHSDGIALDKKGEFLYYQALTGYSLYRIQTKWLRDTTLTESQLGEKVERLGRPGAADGIAYGPDRHVYLTSLEFNAIRRFDPEEGVEIVVQDSLLKWPDSIAFAMDGSLYVTTSQLHLGNQRMEPYRILKFEPR
jgi:sugar lactone lactonase YvrE